MIIYAIEFVLLHSLFFLVYKLLLTNETQLNFRRFFLLGSTLLSLIIPLVAIPTSSPIATINLSEVMVTYGALPVTAHPAELGFTVPWYYWLIGGIGITHLLRLLYGLFKIGRWYRESVLDELYTRPVRKVANLKNSFTFLRWIFIDPSHFKNNEAVVHHEWGHSQHLHSIDVLFYNLVAVLFWWSPSVWFTLREAKKVHEYQADQYALRSTEAQSYIKTLVHSTIKSHGMNLASSFDDTPIVKRLNFMKMIKRKINPFKVGSIVAIVAITGLVFACEEDLKEGIIEVVDDTSSQYSEQVQLALEDLAAEFPGIEFNVVITEITTTEMLEEIDEYKSKRVKRIFVDVDENNSSRLTVISAANEEEFDKKTSASNAILGNDVFTEVDQVPFYIGGINKFYEYIASKISYPKNDREMGIEGRVYIQFIVERNGSISNAKIVKGISESCDKEALRVFKNLPDFSPGFHRGKSVRVRMVLPIVFRLDGGKSASSQTEIQMDRSAMEIVEE